MSGFFRELTEALSWRNRRLPPQEERELHHSQRETLKVLKAVAAEAQNEEALAFARRREREIRRIEQEHELYNIEREDERQ